MVFKKSILRLLLIKTGFSLGLKWRTSFMFGSTEAESYLHTWSLQNWSVQCVLNMTFSETALTDHFVALGFKQAGTSFLVLRQKAAASDNSLGSIRHLLHVYPRLVGAEFGKVCLFEICGSHSTALLSPHTHWRGIHIPASQGAAAAPQTYKITVFPCSKDHRDTLRICCTSAFPL